MATIDAMSSPSSNFTMSSSPSLPSLSEIMKRAPALRTGSRAAPVPSAASATFTSASSLLRNNLSETRGIASIRAFQAPPDNDKPAKSAKPKLADGEELSAKPKARKSRAKKITEGDEVQEKKPAARRKKAASKDEDEPAVKEKAPRKPRAKKAESQTQPKLSKARVTKSSAGADGARGKVAKKALPTVEGSAGRVTTKVLASIENSVGEKQHSIATSNDALSGRAVGTDVAPKPLSTKSFSSMMNTFRSGEGSHQQESVERERPSTTKRKSPEISKADALPVKPKPARKKAKTITDQATAAYVKDAAETVELLKKPGAITDFFQLQPKAGEGERAVSHGRPSILPRPKPGDKNRPIVLQSPESAIKIINEQEVLFGTSSQLAREDSPSFLRDLDQALRESNAADDYFSTDSGNDFSRSTSTSQRIMSRSGRSNLWGAASRDQSGKLVDVVDLSKTPVAKVKSIPTHLITDENATESIRMSTELPKVTRDVISLDTPDAISSFLPEMDTPVKITQKPAVDTLANAAKSKPVTRKPRAKKAVSTEKPDYSSYTTEQLTKTVASFGFKVVKKREQMILLLNKCWEGQHGGTPSGEASISTTKPSKEAPIPKAAPASKADTPKKPRGRPKKVVEACPSIPIAKPPVLSKPLPKKVESDSDEKPLKLRMTKKPKRKAEDQVSDSESSITKSPSRRKKALKTKPTIAPKLSDETDSDTQALQAELYLHITKAIKSIPPSTSPTDPNWYEKILLYDPIVLEDLTIWLNTGGLERVGWDGEVCPVEVKGWCESKSVCCLWRENLKGGARSRY